jgi:hypothetical protein
VIPAPPIVDAAPFISAGAGVVGVAVALSGDLLRRRWQRPKLRFLPFRAQQGDGVFVDDFDVEQSAWIRLGVRNDGRETARNVEVHIEDIVETDPRPDAQRRETFQKQQLVLLVGRRLKWADRDDKTIDIPPGMVRRVDVAHLSTREPSYSIGETLCIPIRFKLDRDRDHSRRDIVAGLAYNLQLSVSGDNCHTAFFNARLEFGGTWLGAESVNPLEHGSLRVVRVEPG